MLQVLSLCEMLFPQVCHEAEILVEQLNRSVIQGGGDWELKENTNRVPGLKIY